MVLPNVKIYTMAYLSDTVRERLLPVLEKIAEDTKTQIGYDGREQCIYIDGRSRQACEKTAERIIRTVVPNLHRGIDACMLRGTYPDWKTATLASESASPLSSDAKDAPTDEDEDDVDDVDDEDDEDSSDYDSDDSLQMQMGKRSTRAKATNVSQQRQKAQTLQRDKEVLLTFAFAKNVKNVEDVLTGPPLNAMAQADYLAQISEDTGTECSLVGREVHVFGPESAAKEAIERFKVCQTLYKRQRRQPDSFVYIHHPENLAESDIFLCPVQHYAQNHFCVIDQKNVNTSYVALPAVINPQTGKHIKPRDLLDTPKQPTVASLPTQEPARASPPPPSRSLQQQQDVDDLDEQMRRFSLQTGGGSRPQQGVPPVRREWGAPEQSVPTTQNFPGLPQRGGRGNSAGSARGARGARGGWGGRGGQGGRGRGGWGNPSSPQQQQQHQRQQQQQQVMSPNHGDWRGQQVRPSGDQDNFPSLTPTKAPQPGGPKRRVMRISNQKSGRPSKLADDSSGDAYQRVQDFYYNRTRSLLLDGLDAMRTFRGRLELKAKLGKVFFSNLTSELQQKKWNTFDINDVLLKQHGATAYFNNVTSMSEHLMSRLSVPFSRYKVVRMAPVFELHVDARPTMKDPFKPAILYMDGDGTHARGLTLHQNVISEVNVVSLDRKYDYQVTLTASEIGRSNVKPFITLTRRLLVRADTKHLSFERLPNVIRVNKVLHKEVLKCQYMDRYTVTFSKIEHVPVMDDEEEGRSVAKKGQGQTYIDVEVTCKNLEPFFKQNENKTVGDYVDWRPEDVLDQDDNLKHFLNTMTKIVNDIDTSFK